MAVLSSPTANNNATVDSSVKALRVIDYGNLGNPINLNSANAYILAINQGFTSTTYTPPAYITWLANPIGSGIDVYVRELHSILTSDPSAVAASQQEIAITKSVGISATAPLGFTITKLNQSSPDPSAQYIMGGTLPAKYTELSVIDVLRCPRYHHSRATSILKFGSPRSRNNVLILKEGESLVYKMLQAAPASPGGDVLSGYIIWEER